MVTSVQFSTHQLVPRSLPFLFSLAVFAVSSLAFGAVIQGQGVQEKRRDSGHERRRDSIQLNAGTVIPFRLNQPITSNNSQFGDKFTADLDTEGRDSYQGLPQGAVLEGHVNVVRAKRSDTPGVVSLSFDRLRMPNGQIYPITGKLIGLDNGVYRKDGRIVARPGAQDYLRFVGYGNGDTLVNIYTHGARLADNNINRALGNIYGEIQRDRSKSHDVALQPGQMFGVRLTKAATFRVGR